jgi:8-oxo-dGTP pyrophosphatase MutT (NUDIX family)
MAEPNDVTMAVIGDREELLVRAQGQVWVLSWHAPPTPPEGGHHGASGICVTDDGLVVLVGTDGEHWDLPAGRPEAGETWEQTLRREMLEEACATVRLARLLGFTRGCCLAGPERGLVLVRTVWRADVELGPWEPRFEIPYRRLVPPGQLRTLIGGPYAPITRRTLLEAGVW